MRRITVLAVLVAAPLVLADRAEAQVGLGPTLAFHDDFDAGIGAGLSAPVPSISPSVRFLGDFTFFFPDNDAIDYWEMNADISWDLPVGATSVAPFLLGGLNLAHVSVGNPLDGADDTDLGVNLGGGLRFTAGRLDPLIGVRAELGGGEGVVLFFTLPFHMGG